MCRVMGLYARDDYARRVRYRRAFVVVLTVLPAVLYLVFASPVKMVVAGGIVQSVMLPVVGFGTLYLRHRRLPAEMAPSGAVTVGLWVCSVVMLAAALYYLSSLPALKAVLQPALHRREHVLLRRLVEQLVVEVVPEDGRDVRRRRRRHPARGRVRVHDVVAARGEHQQRRGPARRAPRGRARSPAAARGTIRRRPSG